MAISNIAKFSIGEVVKHRHFDFRGVIYDVDFEFNNSEEWYQSIPKEVRPRKDQPFYHLLAESNDVNKNIAKREALFFTFFGSIKRFKSFYYMMLIFSKRF